MVAFAAYFDIQSVHGVMQRVRIFRDQQGHFRQSLGHRGGSIATTGDPRRAVILSNAESPKKDC